MRDLDELLRDAEAHYENALDDIYYGYGFQFWRTHFDCDTDLTDDEAELVWKVAKWVKTDDYCAGIERLFPRLSVAYKWMTEGVPRLEPDDAVEVYHKAEDIAEKFKPVAKYLDDHDCCRVYLEDTNSGMGFWFEQWLDEQHHDINCDWNQSMFLLDNEDDVLRKLLQEDNWVFDLISSEALSFQQEQGVFVQAEDGKWYPGPNYKNPD